MENWLKHMHSEFPNIFVSQKVSKKKKKFNCSHSPFFFCRNCFHKQFLDMPKSPTYFLELQGMLVQLVFMQ